MKLNYKVQMGICLVIILLANIIGTLLNHWIYRSIGFVLCGLLFILHPVVPKYIKGDKNALFWTRIAGLLLVVIGVFTRAYP